MIVRSLVVWLGITILAIVNGAIRETMIVPRFGQQYGHVISTLLLTAIVLAVAFICIRWIGPLDLRSAMQIGVIWFVMTLAFEFLAGHYIFGSPWATILADYDIANGRIWPLVPLTTLLAPGWSWIRLNRPEHT